MRMAQHLLLKKETIILFNPYKADKYSDLDIYLLYVIGGNTFAGLKLLKDTGFDEAIKKYVNNGVTYLGKSAGTHISTKNIEHVLEFDPNDVGLTDYEGLGLFDGIVVCHYDKSREDCYDRLLLENNYNVYTLTDQEIYAQWTINQYNVSGTGSLEYTYSYPKQKLWVMFEDKKTVETAKEKIKDVLNK